MPLTTYDEAMRSKSATVWPGCNGTGCCRPCGVIHDFSYPGWNGQTEHRFRCSQNQRGGCPSPLPEPAHTWEKGRCVSCGQRARWVHPDGRGWRTLAAAKRDGVPRGALYRESEIEGERTP